MTRPTVNDPDVLAMAVDKILPQVVEWLEPEKYPEDEIRSELMQRYATDGYEFASNLEKYSHWRDRSAYIVQCVCGKTVESHEPVITCPALPADYRRKPVERTCQPT